ncbi:hypothetical protein X801_04637 [Opisthorchis viverrini]|uniref:IST1 homolog n=1 Tax=Opisthorchis viverrini TaxID=6198 RepID=A0A1S8WYJ2_OPIVI|nr:hypothetical protein X801_04637 [Opisthorchis viverrini]
MALSKPNNLVSLFLPFSLITRMPLFAKTCDYTKLKSNLRLCVNRMGLLQKKKTEMGMKARREVAELLKQNKIERSRIKTEHIVREDYVVEALEILQTYCELLLARFGIFEVSKEVDPCLEEAIASIIWSCPRLSSQVNELPVIREQFAGKYSKEYVEACLENKLRKVSPMVMQKLEIIQPPPSLVEMYMIEIAKAYGVEYEPNLEFLNSSTSDGSGGGGGGGASRNAENQLINFEPDLLPCMPSMPADFTTGNPDKPWEHTADSGPGAPYPQQSPFPGPAEIPPPCAPKGLSPDAQVGYYGYQPAPPPAYDAAMFPEKNPHPPLPPVGPVGSPDPPVPSADPSVAVPPRDSDSTSDEGGNDDQDFDELQRRFQQLTNKK